MTFHKNKRPKYYLLSEGRKHELVPLVLRAGPGDGVTVLGLSVGIRNVVEPPLPDGCYGNAYIDMYVPLTAREVDEFTISYIVKLIKEAKIKAHDKEYLQEELANTENIIKILHITSLSYREDVVAGKWYKAHIQPNTLETFTLIVPTHRTNELQRKLKR